MDIIIHYQRLFNHRIIISSSSSSSIPNLSYIVTYVAMSVFLVAISASLTPNAVLQASRSATVERQTSLWEYNSSRISSLVISTVHSSSHERPVKVRCVMLNTHGSYICSLEYMRLIVPISNQIPHPVSYLYLFLSGKSWDGEAVIVSNRSLSILPFLLVLFMMKD